MGARLVLLGGVLAWSGCTLALGDDVCGRTGGPERTINQRTEDEQVLFGPRSIVALPNGSALVAFGSLRTTSGAREDELRVAALRPDGSRSASTCGDDREVSVWSSVGGADGELVSVALAAPLALEEPAALVWSAGGGAVEGAVRVTGIDPATSCAIATAVVGTTPPGTLPIATSAVRTGPGEYFVVWSEPGLPGRIAARAVWLLPVGDPRFLVAYDGLEGRFRDDAPATITTFDGVARTLRATALGDEHIAIAAVLLRGLGYEVHVAILTRAGEVVVPAFPISAPVPELAPGTDVDLAFDGTQLLVSWVELEAGAARAHLLGRLLTPDGDFLRSPLSPDAEPFEISATDAEGLQPSVVAREGGGFLVAFTRRDASGSLESRAIAVVGLDAEGERQFLAPVCARADLVVSRGGVSATAPSAVLLADQTLALAWTAIEAGGVDADGSGIAGRVFPARDLFPLPPSP